MSDVIRGGEHGFRNLIRVGVASLAALTLTACEGDEVDPVTERELESINDDMRNLTFQHELPDGTILQTSYETDYNVDQWKITSPKTLDFTLSILDDGDETTNPMVFVEHVHADASLQSTRTGLDGLAQDSMDDSIHGAEQPGFLVTEDVSYTDTFVVEGYSDMLISGWGFASGGSGASDISQERLNEENLADAGVTGNQFSFIYDIVQQDGETGFFFKSDVIQDEFLVVTRAYRDLVAQQESEALK